MTTIAHPVLLFDGVCNLCSSAVQFVIKQDTRKLFRFASLQSVAGQEILNKHHLSKTDFHSFILLQNGKIYTKSTAALMVAKCLTAPWSILHLFMLVPPFIRDSIYGIIARNRYSWFGKKEHCFLPSPELTSRFLG
ncbi:MAG: thiol-disulfide oxidoreductase DCC family protein [Bacteroidota bacterium]|nr:thiol-disulfide oxidoreductase DCC family protein [Bacteroidota bacterium]